MVLNYAQGFNFIKTLYPYLAYDPSVKYDSAPAYIPLKSNNTAF